MHIAVPISELKAHLSHILAQAQTGTVIEVTSHNRPIAHIIGIPSTENTGINRLLGAGALTWTGNKPNYTTPLILNNKDNKRTTVSQIILEDRR